MQQYPLLFKLQGVRITYFLRYSGYGLLYPKKKAANRLPFQYTDI